MFMRVSLYIHVTIKNIMCTAEAFRFYTYIRESVYECYICRRVMHRSRQPVFNNFFFVSFFLNFFLTYSC